MKKLNDHQKFEQWLMSLDIAQLSSIVHTANVLDVDTVVEFVDDEGEQVIINDFLDDVYRIAERIWAMRMVSDPLEDLDQEEQWKDEESSLDLDQS